MSFATVHPWRPATDAGGRGAVSPSSPTVARWELALRIRERRRELGLDVKTITDQLGFSRNYWSAIEHDRTLLAKDKLERLFEILTFDDTERVELTALWHAGKKRGWWMDYPALHDERLIHFYGLEAGAKNIRAYESALVNGLLQTDEYARVLIEADPAVSLVDVDQLVEVRKRRQRRLRGHDPLQLTALMSEAALHQQVGGSSAMRRQLLHLAKLITDLPDSLDVRIVPFGVTPGGIAGASTFHLLNFPNERLATVAWRESVAPMGGVIGAPDDVRRLELSYGQALEFCLDQEVSLDLIQRMAAKLS